MKILLVNPPIPEFYYNREFYLPSGLLYLASSLQKNGEEVKMLDLKTFQNKGVNRPLKFYEDKLIETISGFQPDLIGFGCLFSGNFPEMLRFSEISKNNFRKIPIITGGIHPTIHAENIMKNCISIDFIVIGEGEMTIVQLVNEIKNKSYEFDKIDGLAFRENGKVMVNPKTRYVENVDNLPFPAYDLINLKDYYVDTSNWHNPKNLPINTSIPIISSRSCPNRCTFCSMFEVMGPTWRARSAKNVVDEIEYLYKNFDQMHFSFMDDNFTLGRSRLTEICDEIIKRKLDIQFETPNGLSIKTLDEEVLNSMVSAGLVRISLALESGSDFIRNKVMGKNLSQEKIYDVVNLTKKYRQLYVNAFFIIGMPEETEETLNETYNMIKKINVDKVYVHNIIPFPGTILFEQAARDNLLLNIDLKNLYKSTDLYITNYNDYFIKPYKLSIADLREFRNKCEGLIAKHK
jgi:magnesium-protoporphyrin IX monomethyl ester (oxidative) cyclase